MNPTLIIRKIKMDDIWSAPNCADLLKEYADEYSLKGTPEPTPNIELYKILEQNNFLVAFGSYIEDLLVGFITILLVKGTHYSVVIANTESYFVAKEYRHTGAGTKLRIEAEKTARDAGCPGILLQAPTDGKLSAVLEKSDYEEAYRVFYKRLHHE